MQTGCSPTDSGLAARLDWAVIDRVVESYLRPRVPAHAFEDLVSTVKCNLLRLHPWDEAGITIRHENPLAHIRGIASCRRADFFRKLHRSPATRPLLPEDQQGKIENDEHGEEKRYEAPSDPFVGSDAACSLDASDGSAAQLAAIMECLNPREREFVDRRLRGHSYHQIARAMGYGTVNGVKAIMHRIKRKVLGELGPQD